MAGKASKKNERVEKAFEFLREHAESRAEFTLDEMVASTGWLEASAKTYISKQWRHLLESVGPRRYRVLPDFLRLSREAFRGHISQTRLIYTDYLRKKHEQLLTYEFLLPLTREDALRKSLDDLFYADTIERRLKEIDAADLRRLFQADLAETTEMLITRVRDFVADKIGGYSISHVSGRFRAAPLIRREEVGALLADEGRYLVDETTAVVRFVIPFKTGMVEYKNDFASMREALAAIEVCDMGALDEELERTRVMFFLLFVEAVVRTVKGEDQIWLIEESTTYRRLYVWEKTST